MQVVKCSRRFGENPLAFVKVDSGDVKGTFYFSSPSELSSAELRKKSRMSL